MARLSKEEKRELLRKRNAERDAQQGKGFGGVFDLLDMSEFEDVPIFSLEDGNNYLDIVPYEVSSKNHPQGYEKGEDDYKLAVWAHRNIGPKNAWVLCLETLGKACPICEEKEFLKSKEGGGHEYDDKVVKALNASSRVFYNVIDVGNSAKTDAVQLFENAGATKPTKWFEALVSTEAKASGEETIAFYDIEDGRTIKVRAETEVFDKREFVKPTRVDFEEREPFGEEIYDEVYPLDAMLKIPTYDEVKELLYGSEGDDGDDEDKDDKKKETGRSTRKRGGRNTEKAEADEPKETGRSRRSAKSKEKEEEKPSGRGRRGKSKEKEKEEKPSGRSRRTKTKEEEPEPENEIDGECPADHIFGVHHNIHDSCVDCDDETWDHCADTKKEIEKQNKASEQKESKSSKRTRRGK